MNKEMIISVNAYEKRVAILEDGVVVEFYVERADESKAVVGNIYKGRVRKVLPGMQSAFVDIGLERDAFLYVGDFFEETEEDLDTEEIVSKAPAERVERLERQPEPGHRGTETRSGERGRRSDELHEPPSVTTKPTGEAELVVGVEPAAESAVVGREQEGESVEKPAGETKIDTPLLSSLLGGGAGTQFERVSDEEEQPTLEVSPPSPEAEAGSAAEATTPLVEQLQSEREALAESLEPGASRKRQRKRRQEIIGEEKKKTSRRRSQRGEEEIAALLAEAKTTAASPTEVQFERVQDEEYAEEAGDLLKDAIIQQKIIAQTRIEESITKAEEPTPEPVETPTHSEPPFEPLTLGYERIADDDEQVATAAPSTSTSAASTPVETSPTKEVPAVADTVEGRDATAVESKTGTTASGDGASVEEKAEADAAGEGETEDGAAQLHVRPPQSEFPSRRGRRGRRRSGRSISTAGEEAVEAEDRSHSPGEGSNAILETEGTEALSLTDAQGAGELRHDRPEALRRQPAITDLLREGQEIIVQIAKEPIGLKGARITSYVSLPGRYLVYLPTISHIGVSRKISTEQERARLKRILTTLREREGVSGGFIVRTACEGCSEQDLYEDMLYLVRTWRDIRRRAEQARPGTVLCRELDLVQRLLRDHMSSDFSVIRVDDPGEYANIVEFINRFQPKLVDRVRLYTRNRPIFEEYNIQPEIEAALKPRVWLKSGGFIVINQTEALVAIDVNTGKFVGKSDRLEDTITRTNLEAAVEIVRQIRLRDLGGIIVLDFIDMEDRRNRQKVMQVLEQAMKADRSPSKITSFNDFGLVAITRKRVRQSLERILSEPCPYCGGSGMVKSAQTMCYEILSDAKHLAKEKAATGQAFSEVTLRVSPQVAALLRGAEARVLREIEFSFGTPVTLHSDPNIHQERYDFAFM
jgi:ribonuclease G